MRGRSAAGPALIAGYIALPHILPGGKRIRVYSIRTLKRRRPAWFREDLATLFMLLRGRKIKPLIAERIPLAQARRAHEMPGQGVVRGKLVLTRGQAGPQALLRKPCSATAPSVPANGMIPRSWRRSER